MSFVKALSVGQVQSFKGLAAHLKSLIEFLPEGVQSIAKEFFVRHLAGMHFRRSHKKFAPSCSPVLAVH